jgi:hypothetical protein
MEVPNMPPLSKYPRWAVLQALLRVRARVAHGDPSLTAALHYGCARLTERAWIETTRVLDAVLFDLAEVPTGEAPPPRRGESPEASEVRELLQVAKANAALPWESQEGFTREQLIAVLTLAVESVRNMPPNGLGPLFPSPLPILDRSDS